MLPDMSRRGPRRSPLHEQGLQEGRRPDGSARYVPERPAPTRPALRGILATTPGTPEHAAAVARRYQQEAERDDD